MTRTKDAEGRARRARHDLIRAEVAQEEAEQAEAEIMEKAGVLDVPLHLRIDRDLDTRLRRRAEADQVPTSALVRRLLRSALAEQSPGLTAADVENIARRVATSVARKELRAR
jgi:hypothetical protein